MEDASSALIQPYTRHTTLLKLEFAGGDLLYDHAFCSVILLATAGKRSLFLKYRSIYMTSPHLFLFCQSCCVQVGPDLLL